MCGLMVCMVDSGMSGLDSILARVVVLCFSSILFYIVVLLELPSIQEHISLRET